MAKLYVEDIYELFKRRKKNSSRNILAALDSYGSENNLKLCFIKMYSKTFVANTGSILKDNVFS